MEYSFFFLFFLYLFGFPLNKRLIYCYDQINIIFDDSNLSIKNKQLIAELNKEFEIVRNLLKSLISISSNNNLIKFETFIKSNNTINCIDNKIYKIKNFEKIKNYNILILVLNEKAKNNYSSFKLKPCLSKEYSKGIAILDMINIENEILTLGNKNSNRNPLRWKLIRSVLDFMGLNPSKLENKKIINHYKIKKKKNIFTLIYKKYLLMLDIKKNLNSTIPNINFLKEKNNEKWTLLPKLNDVLVKLPQKNYFKTSLTEFTTSVLNDIYNYKVIKSNMIKINDKCFRFDKKCIYENQLGDYFVEYSFKNNLKNDDSSFTCYFNTKKNIKKNQCGVLYGNLLDNSIISKKEMTYNYELPPRIYRIQNRLNSENNYPKELDFYSSQKLYLLNPSPKCPKKHPRTIFFVNKNNIHGYSELIKTYNIDIEVIKEPKFFMTYILGEKDKIFEEVCLINNFIPLYLLGHQNILWYYDFKTQKIRLNKYQLKWRYIFSHLYKDGLHKFYYRMRKRFPNDYNFMMEEYLYPLEKDIIEKKFKNYSYNEKDVWLYKPARASAGIKIRIIKNYKDIIKTQKSRFIISKYLINPYLIKGKKFDFRAYLLITGIKPLRLYFYKEGFIRFATGNFTMNKKSINNKFIHLTNIMINRENKKAYNKAKNLNDFYSSIWSYKIFRDYCKKNKIDYQKIREQMKDIMIKTIISFYQKLKKGLRKGVAEDRNIMQVYGYDFILDEQLNVVLLEINSNPTIDRESKVESNVHNLMIPDILNIKGIIPYAHDGTNITYDKDIYIYKNETEENVDDALCEFERPTGLFDRIFPLKENIQNYKQFFENIEPENILLWEKMIKD